MTSGVVSRRAVGPRAVHALGTVLVLALLAGCASTASLPGHRHGARVRPVGQDGPPADPRQLAVVERWAAALRAGHLNTAAALFHLPSLFANGATDTITIHSAAEAIAANSTLTCGAVVISAFRKGRFIDVLFRLTARSGVGGGRRACGSGIGQTARTEFVIRDGQIIEWVRAPSLPGDPGVPRTPTPGGGGGAGGNTGAGSLPA